MCFESLDFGPKHEMSEIEETLHCPYNFAHVVLKARMPAHLIKCRTHHPTENFECCPINSTHVVPVPELEYHVQNCPDLKLVESRIYVIGESKPVDLKSVHIETPSSSENWDEEECPGASFLDVKDQVLEKQRVFRQPVGKSKAQRKIFFQNEVRKFGETSAENLDSPKDTLK